MHGLQAGATWSEHIEVVAVAHMHGSTGLDAEAGTDGQVGRRIRLGDPQSFGGEHRPEPAAKAERFQLRVLLLFGSVGQHGEFEWGRGESGQCRLDVRQCAPGSLVTSEIAGEHGIQIGVVPKCRADQREKVLQPAAALLGQADLPGAPSR
jgi:hypothetical protein